MADRCKCGGRLWTDALCFGCMEEQVRAVDPKNAKVADQQALGGMAERAVRGLPAEQVVRVMWGYQPRRNLPVEEQGPPA